MGETGSEPKGHDWIFPGMARVSERSEKAPEAGDASLGVERAFRHTVVRAIPWSGCVPAEPASVSLGARDVQEVWLASKSKQADEPARQSVKMSWSRGPDRV